jgi:GDP-D-mannose 3', 5'-epimerase
MLSSAARSPAASATAQRLVDIVAAMAESVLVTGAGGFIGGHLVDLLLRSGAQVRAVDVRPFEHWHRVHDDAENRRADLRRREACLSATDGVEDVYNLAADMGGIGFIEAQKGACMLSVLINTHMLEAARELGVKRFFFSSSACVYAAEKQDSPEVSPLREEDAYPAAPEDGYGWEKLFSERMCRHFSEDFGLETRVARYHNVYGPHGTFEGGREKAPAAICRKVAEAKLSGNHEIEVWGDGQQTRSFTYIDDCIEGTLGIMESSVREPLNLGSSELVTINELIEMVERIAGITVERRHNLDAPQGVRGRNSDNTLIRAALHWEPTTPLAVGLEPTFRWINDQLARRVAV